MDDREEKERLRKLTPEYSKLQCDLYAMNGAGLFGFTLGTPLAVISRMFLNPTIPMTLLIIV